MNNTPANTQLTMNLGPDIAATLRQARTALTSYRPRRWILQVLREAQDNEALPVVTSPDQAAAYWKREIDSDPHVSREVESFVVLMINTRRHCKGHVIVSTGNLDHVLVHPREVFRPAIVAAASAIIVMHNHPGGIPDPSEQDIRVTRDLVRAGNLLKIELLDHVIMGQPSASNPAGFVSLRELGYLTV